MISVGGLAVVRAGWGVALLLAGHRLLHAVTGGRSTPGDLTAARVLGTRDVVQAAGQLVAPGLAARAGVAVDTIHAVSMLGVAAASRRHRSAAVASGLVAGGFAVLGARALTPGGAASQHARRRS